MHKIIYFLNIDVKKQKRRIIDPTLKDECLMVVSKNLHKRHRHMII